MCRNTSPDGGGGSGVSNVVLSYVNDVVRLPMPETENAPSCEWTCVFNFNLHRNRVSAD